MVFQIAQSSKNINPCKVCYVGHAALPIFCPGFPQNHPQMHKEFIKEFLMGKQQQHKQMGSCKIGGCV